MNKERIINAARAGMMRGKRFKPQEIGQYENAVLQSDIDDRLEVMMLYFAEVLHDELGFGMKRTQNILTKIDDHMHEWLDDEFRIDDLRIRVFGKTNFIFAPDPDKFEHIKELLENAGFKVKTEEDLLDRKDK